MNIKQIAAKYGMSVRAVGRRFGIPMPTVESWSAGTRKPPEYVLIMIDEILSNEQNYQQKQQNREAINK